MNQETLDRFAIRELIENWALWRDAGERRDAITHEQPETSGAMMQIGAHIVKRSEDLPSGAG